MHIIVHAVPATNLFFLAKRNFPLMLFLFMVGKQDAKYGHLGTSFAVFIHFSSKFAFQTIIIMLVVFLFQRVSAGK